MNSLHALDEGLIFDIQRYCLHDGPGIRTTVFLSGCPLRCAWCCNPESFDLDLTSHRPISASDLARELALDLPFFRQSGGGVTFSGGEPLLQSRFVAFVVDELAAMGVDIAIETSGAVPWDAFDTLEGKGVHYLFDIKHTDSEKHIRYTGQGNATILRNLARLVRCGNNITLRLPLIPGINLTAEHAMNVAEIAGELHIVKAHLLPYHRLAKQKYLGLGLTFLHDSTPDAMTDPDARVQISDFARLLEASGITTYLGG